MSRPVLMRSMSSSSAVAGVGAPFLAALFLAALVLFAGPAYAIFTEKPLPDPVQEERAQHLMKEFRCLVCQNQAISESHAPLAQDLRVIVRERIAAGDSDGQVRDYLVDRYGDWVLLDPTFNWKTVVLWSSGAVILLLGVGLVVVRLRRTVTGPQVAPAPLSDADRAELERIRRGEMPGIDGDRG